MGPGKLSTAETDQLQAHLHRLLSVSRFPNHDEVDSKDEVTPEDGVYWDQVAQNATLLADVGVLIATMRFSDVDQWVHVLQSMLLHPVLSQSVGVVHVVDAAIYGMYVAKRWTFAYATAWKLANILNKHLDRFLVHNSDAKNLRELQYAYLHLYLKLLLGYQHSGDLFVHHHMYLIEYASRIATLGDPECVRLFVVGCAALIHCHRGYEHEGWELRNSLETTFGPEQANVSTDLCAKVLRDAAWILPRDKVDAYMSCIEGKWSMDEFSTEQHASAVNLPQNAGSIVLKKVANCLSYDFTATITQRDQKQPLQLDGAIYRRIDTEDDRSNSEWRVEGNWRQLLEPLHDGAVSTAPSMPEEWICSVCTLNNEPMATKCLTCAADGPQRNVAITKEGSRGTNPGPFQAIFNGDGSFMRIRWSRGEQHGVWLARKQLSLEGVSPFCFDLAHSVQDGSYTINSHRIPSHAYSPCSTPSRVIMMEKSYSLSTYGELTYQFWIQPQSNTESNGQTIIASSEFRLVWLPSGELKWEIHRNTIQSHLNGVIVITSGHCILTSATFYHVSLAFERDRFRMYVDQALVGESLLDPPSMLLESTSVRSSWLTIGGSLDVNDQDMSGCFQGLIMDVRIWSGIANQKELLEVTHVYGATSALSGHEEGLVGYFPLVGDSERLLMDKSKQENHASVFQAVRQSAEWTSDGVVTSIMSGFCPSVPVDSVPITNVFTNSLNAFELSGSISYRQGVTGLVLQSNSAVWYKHSVPIDGGFTSSLTFDPSTSMNRVVLVFCEASYWTASPMLKEVNQLLCSIVHGNVRSILGSESGGASLMIVLESTDQVNTSLCVYVCKNGQGYLVGRVKKLPLITSSTSLRCMYHADDQMLTIEITVGGQVVSTVVELAVDVALALKLQTGARVRTGLVYPASTDNVASICVRSWMFEVLTVQNDVHQDGVLSSVYPSLSTRVLTTSSADQNPTIACTRVTSDGSPIEQETYGCQTCHIIHGAGMCRICASLCHDGHELVYMGTMITACACSMRGIAGLCKCCQPTEQDEMIANALQSRPNVQLWCCSRCTVVNTMDQRECSVCSNKIPEGSSTLSPPVTSRALVAVNDPPSIPPASVSQSWSCAACTYLNPSDVSTCTMCNSPPPSSNGLITLSQVAATTTVPASSTNWSCTACTMENKASDKICFMCTTPRADVDTIPTAVPVLPIAQVQDVIPMETEDPPIVNLSPRVLPPSPPQQFSVQDETIRRENITALHEFLLHQTLEKRSLSFLNPFSIWDTTVGLMTISIPNTCPYIAYYMNGEYEEKDGYVCGFARFQDTTWQLNGRYKKRGQSQENTMYFQWNIETTRFDGKWYRGDGGGEWKCISFPFQSDFRGLSQPFYSGLVNMKMNLTNVCYQNSFLQTLFLTQSFRRFVLNCTIKSKTLQCIQHLFACLLSSQRPYIASHELQQCVCHMFPFGQQQDTSDFAHFIMEELSISNQVSNVFGGIQATIFICKTCGKSSINREYFWEYLVNMMDLRYTPITDITAITATCSNQVIVPHGYERMNRDLNQDHNGSCPYIYLCLKRKPHMEQQDAITDLVLKVVSIHEPKPVITGYECVEIDLNQGGKKQVYLYYQREKNGSPITDIQVIYGIEAIPDGFKKIPIDLNQGDGNAVYLCYRCDMPITDIQLVSNGLCGYKMIDSNLYLQDGLKQYLAYKVGGTEQVLTDIRVVDTNQVQELIHIGWESLGCLDINHHFMIRRGHGNPIFAIDVFRAPRQVPRYNDYEVIDLYSNDSTIKGDWMGGEEIDRLRKAVRFHSISDPIHEACVVTGTFDDKGEIRALATITSSWGDTTIRSKRMMGYWTNAKTKYAQLFDVEIRPNGVDGSYELQGTIGDGRGHPIAIKGKQISKTIRVKWPISEILVLRGDERVPEGVEIIRETCSGRLGNLLIQTQSPHTLYLAVKRQQSTEEGHVEYVNDVCVIYGEIDAVPDGYTCIETTPSGFSANLNDGTVSDIPIMICYRRSSTDKKALMDLGLMWTSGPQIDSLPHGFTKVSHTPLGMNANLNEGTNGVSIHLCFSKCNPNEIVIPMEDAMNGEYEIIHQGATTNGPSLFGSFIRLAVLERVMDGVQILEGKFGTVFAGELPGKVYGTLYTLSKGMDSSPKRMITGLWTTDEQNLSSIIDFVPPSFPFEWTLNDTGNELDGWWSGPNEDTSITPANSPAKKRNPAPSPSKGHVWKLMKDAYVRIAYKKDYGTEWRDGQLISSERVWRHDIDTMLSRSVALRTLGGDNLLSCSECQHKTESRTHTVVVAPPEHLILTLKRMYYDGVQKKTRKCLHDVAFSSLMTLPALSEEDEHMLYTAEDIQSGVRDSQRMRQYGLYGILVHSGLTANSGHYYSFCRESDDSSHELHLQDASTAPWIKFNDMRVERSSWSEINRTVSNSVSDTVYLLLYKRLSYVVPATTMDDVEMKEFEENDEDEAMLLAKAMALSMSRASQQKARSEEESDTKRQWINPSILKEIEQANAQYLTTLATTATSDVHVNDLHTVVALRNGISPLVSKQREEKDN